jgi:hypothetical protein
LAETLTGGLPPPDPCSLYPLSTEFVNPPKKKLLGTPLVYPNNEFLHFRMNHAISLAAMTFNSKMMLLVSDLSYIKDSSSMF